jgi:ketosteroid isomerase-like protein
VMHDAGRRVLVERHHDASARGDMDAVHAIYRDDARPSWTSQLGGSSVRETCGSRSTSSAMTESR